MVRNCVCVAPAAVDEAIPVLEPLLLLPRPRPRGHGGRSGRGRDQPPAAAAVAAAAVAEVMSGPVATVVSERGAAIVLEHAVLDSIKKEAC